MTTPRARSDNQINLSTDNIKFCSLFFNAINRVNPSTPIYEKIKTAIQKQIETHTKVMGVKNFEITQFYFKANPIIIEFKYAKDFDTIKLTLEFSDKKAVFSFFSEGWNDDSDSKTITVENNTLKPNEAKQELQEFLSYIDSNDLRVLLSQPLPPVPLSHSTSSEPYQYEEKFVTETLTENGGKNFLHSIYDIIQSADKDTRQLILTEIQQRIKAHYNSANVVFETPRFDNNQIIIKYHVQISADERYDGSLEFGRKICKFEETHQYGGSQKKIFKKIITVSDRIEIYTDDDGFRTSGRSPSESLYYLKKFFSDFKLDTISELLAHQFNLIPVQSQYQEALPEYPAPEYQATLPGISASQEDSESSAPPYSSTEDSEPSAPPYSSTEDKEDDRYAVNKPVVQTFPESSASPLPDQDGNLYQEYAGVQCRLLPEYKEAPGWWSWLTFQTKTVHVKYGELGLIKHNGKEEFLAPGIYHLPSTTQWRKNVKATDLYVNHENQTIMTIPERYHALSPTQSQQYFKGMERSGDNYKKYSAEFDIPCVSDSYLKRLEKETPYQGNWFWTRIATWCRNWIWGQTVKEGEVGLIRVNGRPEFLAPGTYHLPSSVEWVKTVDVNEKVIHHDSITIANIKSADDSLDVEDNALLGQSGNVESDVFLDKGIHVIDSPTIIIYNSDDAPKLDLLDKKLSHPLKEPFDKTSRAEREAADTRNSAPYLQHAGRYFRADSVIPNAPSGHLHIHPDKKSNRRV